jgi:tetratricopeptide (TPR) repeat protein
MNRTALTIAALIISTPLAAKPLAVSPLSQQLAAKGQQLAAQGKWPEALDQYETAVAADPKNGAAYVAMGRAYEQLGLPGKALRYYRLALDINPADLSALEAQALGMIGKGAPSKAEAPINRIRKLCPKGCPSLTRVDAAMAKTAQKSSANRTVVPRTGLPPKKTQPR